MAAATVKRRFKITGITATPMPGADPGNPIPAVTVTAEAVDDSGARLPANPGGYQWPFADADGSVAAFFVVNQVVEITFAVPAAPAS